MNDKKHLEDQLHYSLNRHPLYEKIVYLILRELLCDRCRANIKQEKSAGKHTTTTKRGVDATGANRWERSKAREMVKLKQSPICLHEP